jgi:hypothetical protein
MPRQGVADCERPTGLKIDNMESEIDNAKGRQPLAMRPLQRRHVPPAPSLLTGVEGEEFEDVMLSANPRFWEMIEASRKDPNRIPLSEIRKRFSTPPKE